MPRHINCTALAFLGFDAEKFVCLPAEASRRIQKMELDAVSSSARQPIFYNLLFPCYLHT